MLEILRTDSGEIKAVCEQYIVDEKGNWDTTNKFIWISEIEVSPQYRNNGCLKHFIKPIMDKVPWAEYGYFWRKRKYPDKKPVIFNREQWLKMIKEK